MLWAVVVALALTTTGCRVVRSATEVPVQAVRSASPGRTEPAAVNAEEIQQGLLRFANEFLAQVTVGIDQLRHGTNAIPPAEGLRWKIRIATEACAFASGPNPVANLVDLTAFVTVVRQALEEDWRPIFGDSARPLLEGCRSAETKIWEVTVRVLTPPQQAALREAIADWQGRHTRPADMLVAPSVSLSTGLAGAAPADPARTASLLELLRMDPLAGMDPAVREVARSRLLAERALFVAQKLPILLRWQAELLSFDTAQQPAIQQLVSNSTRVATSMERFASTAEALPGQFSRERTAILQALESQEQAVTPLVNEVRQTLAAGQQMSASLNTTLTTFDALMKRFGVGETNHAARQDPPGEPFRIQDYGQTALQLEAAARQLTALLHTLNQTLGSTNLTQLSSQVAPAVQQAQAGGKDLVNYAFWRGVILVLIALLASLAYRVVAARLGRHGSTRASS